MKNLARKRTVSANRGRFLLGVFLLAWLNLTVQPCLMAMEVSPESIVDSAHAAHMNHASRSPGHDCDHCPTALSDHAKSCTSATSSGCSSIPDFDGRTGLSKIKNIPTFVAIVDLAIPGDLDFTASTPPPLDCAVSKYRHEPTLNLLFCVFLK